MQIVLNSAYAIRETRLQAVATGRIIPGVNDRRSSGLFSGDFSDASSISSTGSGSRFRKLRESTDMARASLDSLRRGSKESLDDLFKRGLSITRGGSNQSEDMDRKRASTGDMTRSLSQKLNFATNSLAAKVRRTSSVRSVNNAYQQGGIEDQIHRDWLLANQLNAVENNTFPSSQHHTRQNSISSNASSTTTRTSSLMNRFSQFVSSKPVSPFQPQQQPQQQKQQHHQQERQKSPSMRRTDSSSTLPPPLPISAEEKKQLGISTRESMMSAQQVYRGYV